MSKPILRLPKAEYWGGVQVEVPWYDEEEDGMEERIAQIARIIEERPGAPIAAAREIAALPPIAPTDCRVFCATNDEGAYERIGDQWVYTGALPPLGPAQAPKSERAALLAAIIELDKVKGALVALLPPEPDPRRPDRGDGR